MNKMATNDEEWGVIIREDLALPGGCNHYEVFYRRSYPRTEDRENQVNYSAILMDGHFVLFEGKETVFAGGDKWKLFGVVDHKKLEDREIAEGRLYTRARKYAERLKRERSGPNTDVPLIDKTSRAPKETTLEAVAQQSL